MRSKEIHKLWIADYVLLYTIYVYCNRLGIYKDQNFETRATFNKICVN